MKRVKDLARRIFGDATRLHWDAWRGLVRTKFRAKALVARLFANSLAEHFEAWHRFAHMCVLARKHARRYVGNRRRETPSTGALWDNVPERRFPVVESSGSEDRRSEDRGKRVRFERGREGGLKISQADLDQYLTATQVGYIFSRGVLLVFRAWRRQAKADHLARIEREGARHPHDLLSRFYHNTADAARHRQPTIVNRGPGLPSLPRRPTNRAPRLASTAAEGGAPDWQGAPGQPGAPVVMAEAAAPPTQWDLFPADGGGTVATADTADTADPADLVSRSPADPA